MAIDYAALARSSAQAQERDNLKFDVGETLIMLVPVPAERSYPEGFGSVEVVSYNGKQSAVNAAFGRSVLTYDQPLCESEVYRSIYGEDVPSPCPIANFVATLPAEQQKNSKPRKVKLWVACALAFRRKPTSAWEQIYVKPKWFTAKWGKPASPHLQSELDKIFANSPDKLEAIMENNAARQLLDVNRVGEGNNTAYTISLATGTDPNLGDLSAFVVPDDMLADIDAATAPGGPCDLMNLVATMFSPKENEIIEKLLKG